MPRHNLPAYSRGRAVTLPRNINSVSFRRDKDSLTRLASQQRLARSRWTTKKPVGYASVTHRLLRTGPSDQHDINSVCVTNSPKSGIANPSEARVP